MPELLDVGTAEDGSTWLVTAAIDGRSAVDRPWLAEPRVAVRAIGEGLRSLHEALPVDSCPVAWSAEDRVRRCLERAAMDTLDVSRLHPDHQGLLSEHALAAVADVPPVDRLVVCHGDACAPNTLLDDRARWSGHVDLGALGTADRWADLAVATWSSVRNYGPGWEAELLDAYGIEADEERSRYYRLLWDLAD